LPSVKSASLRSLDLAFIAVLSSFYFLFHLNKGSLASWDEALYASVAKEIVQSGDWFQLRFGGMLWFDKPPLAIWVTALFYKWFGINEFTARAFSALCGAGTVLVTYFLGRRLFGAWTGFLSAFVLLSSSHFLKISRFGMLDAPLTFFLTTALYFFWRGHERNRYLIFSGVFLGLAIMTKGFAAFMVLPVMWVYCWLAGETGVLTRSSYWIGLVIAVLIALPWHVYEMTVHHDSFVRDVVVKHLFTRTTHAIEGHAGNFYFYIRTMVNKYHPWALISVFSAPLFLFKALKRHEPEVIFIASWIFVIFAIITGVQTKLAWYVVPIYPALSISVAYYLARFVDDKKRFLCYVLFFAGMGLHVVYSHIWRQDYSRDIRAIAPLVKEKVPAGSIVYLYEYHESPAAYFYIERNTAYLDTPAAVEERLKAGRKGFYLLIHEDDYTALEKQFVNAGLRPAASAEGLLLLS
jgi:4-amino-4-deoxy-L-arabinose transferase-like glycosyltransferase